MSQPPSHPGYPPPEPPAYRPASPAPPQVRPDPLAPGEPPGRQRGRALGAGVLVAAILLGGAAGFGGAAAYETLAGDQAPSPTPEPGPSAAAVDPVEAVSVNAVARQVLPTVVKITTLTADGQGSGSGSGSVISADGEILTNNHVIEAAALGGTITVSFSDGRPPADATVIGRDPATDLALLRLTSEVEDLSVIEFGDSDTVEVGQAVVAVGSPYGLEATVTAGIVSALHRPIILPQSENPDEATVYGAIQTDASINPGNSGGALVDLAGRQIGVNSIIRTASGSGAGTGDLGNIGIGYAIPISDALPIVEQMRAGEQPTHARLGLTGADATVRPGVTGGAEVASVEPGSAADEAGIRPGDVITGIGEVQVASFFGLLAGVYSFRPGEQTEVTLLRDGAIERVEVTLGSDAEG